MKKILCFGDSNTYGYKPENRLRYDENIRWTTIVQKSLEKYGYEIIEEGLCGRTAGFDDYLPQQNGIKTLPALLKKHSPLCGIIIMLGTNDLKTKFHATAAEITKNIDTLIKQIKDFDKSIKIMIVSPIELGVGISKKDCDFTESRIAVSLQLKNNFSILAKQENCFFFAAGDYTAAGNFDCEHLDASGHQKLAQVIEDRITANF